MFSDDDLMDRLVLKGGNALDIIYRISTRSSIDLDFAIDGDFDDFDILRDKITRVLQSTYDAAGFAAFDVQVTSVPPHLSDDMKGFWGGYNVEFKIIEKGKFEEFKGDVDTLRKRALEVGRVKKLGKSASRKFSIQLSRHEYCERKKSHVLEEYTVYVYSPMMLVCEKLRAICQQMPEYASVVRSHRSARARDFVDIHTVAEAFAIDFRSDECAQVLRDVFHAKRVPLRLLGDVHRYREYHREDFVAVRATVKPNVQLQEYDFYFDDVVNRCKTLETLWNE
ncbi:MAG: nucleotidyl transferase AbiEii/AbiGii toxin family protein [Planctomycetes bacterium]|nr:nucleotidyl transferase AbiEii/AbiGii toxin family protein [Planctomycetota bacterium]